MTEDILTAKIAYGFDYLDASGDGEITEHDHVLMGQRTAAGLGLEPGSSEEDRIVAAFTAIWNDVHLPNLPEGQDAIDKATFIAATKSLDPQGAQATLGAMARTYLSVADADANGRVSAQEFATFQRSHFPDLGQDELDKAFAYLDRNSNGYLSTDEFVRAAIDYWSSADPQAPGNWWMGTPIYQR